MLRTKKTKAKKAATAGKPSKLPIPRRFPVDGNKASKPAEQPREAAAVPAAAVEAAQGQPEAVLAAPAPATPTGLAAPAKLSCLDAAAEVPKASGTPMRCKEMVAAMAAKGLWSSTAPTPHQTLASALLREVTKKGAASRFRKAGRGAFALNLTA